MIKLGLIPHEGVWNEPFVEIAYNYYHGMRPEKQDNIFGLITHNDNFLLLLEDDDHYWVEFTMEEKELHELSNLLDNEDYTSPNKNFKFIVTDTSFGIVFKNSKISFHPTWVFSLKKVLDLKSFIPDKNTLYIGEELEYIDYSKSTIMSPTQYIEYMVATDMFLFFTDKEITRFKILHELFSENIKGIDSNLALQTSLNSNKYTKKIKEIYQHRILDKPLYKGYLEQYNLGTMEEPILINTVPIYGLFRDVDKLDRPDVKYWQIIESNDFTEDMDDNWNYIVPIKITIENSKINFKEKYSLLLVADIFYLYPEWISEFKWYYLKCLEYSKNDEDIQFIKEMLEIISLQEK